MIVYDVTDKRSFEAISEKWMPLLEDNMGKHT